MKYIDNFLNKITMYRLVMHGLMTLAIISVAFGFMGGLSYGGFSLLISFLLITFVCYVTNMLISKIFNVQINTESSAISGLILFFILFPIHDISGALVSVLVGVVAMVSKYVLAIHKKHVFNPVAVAVFVVGLFGFGVGSWWIGSSIMLIPVAVFGFLVLRKVQRFEMFTSFLLTAILSISVVGFIQGSNIYEILRQVLLSGPILFFGAIMLTEPLTTPPTNTLQAIYGAIVGVLFGLQFNIGPIYSTPQLALILGNLFSYFISPKFRLVLVLSEKNKLSEDIYDFVWKIKGFTNKFAFKPGQYLEWTLGHKNPDDRGERRYFTIASSPTEEGIHLGVKFYPESSTFKQKLLSLEPGDEMVASQLSGDFVMPEDHTKKLVFIAGGIGVTPFRSMVKYMIDKGEKREVTLFFANRTPKDIVYKDLFDLAQREIGMKTIYAVNDLAGAIEEPNMYVGFINAEIITREVSDYKNCQYYISGPRSMVDSFEGTLGQMGVPSSQIKTDFFPGYV